MLPPYMAKSMAPHPSSVVAIAILAALLAPATARATYSIVATDSMTGQVGGAVTSCVGSQGVGVVYRPSVGHGGVNAQAAANATGRDRAVVLLGMDVAPADIIQMITTSAFDASFATRQYGIVNLMGRAAGFTGSGAMDYKEDRQNTWGRYTYSIQGNILTGKAVIDQAEMGFQNGGCDLADKMMLTLEAGALNSQGDSRCTTTRRIPSDAASIEVDLAGETAGSFLKLDVAGRGTRARSSSSARCSRPGARPTPCGSNAGDRRHGRRGRSRRRGRRLGGGRRKRGPRRYNGHGRHRGHGDDRQRRNERQRRRRQRRQRLCGYDRNRRHLRGRRRRLLVHRQLRAESGCVRAAARAGASAPTQTTLMSPSPVFGRGSG